jgi:hypothetical protein
MKKYIQPSIEVVEMGTTEVIAASGISLNSDETTTQQEVGRNRGAAWSEYDGQ